MADNNLKFEQINWGWLSDYAGYKFAPITFFDTLYTEDGKSFKALYLQFQEDLRDGDFLVGRAYALGQQNADGSKGYCATTKDVPIYFKDGRPIACDNITLPNGNITAKNITANNLLKGKELLLTGDGFGIKIGNTTKQITDTTKDYTWSHAEIGYASDSSSGLLSTTSQKIKGVKNFLDGVTIGTQAYNVIHAGNYTTEINKGEITNFIFKHDCNKTAASVKGMGTKGSGRYISFYDSDGDAGHQHLLGRLRNRVRPTVAAPDSREQYESVVDLMAYNPLTGTEDDLVIDKKYLPYASLYVAFRGDGSCEAGVRSEPSSGTNAPSAIPKDDVYSTGNIVFMGAAWNDYAEFRDQIETLEPGYCVASNNSGKVYLTSEKCQACDGIVSDTYGFAIGRTEQYQTPLAVSGRVLAYFNGERLEYQAGDTVCAGPNGKICKMTREEIREYPDRIVGIVSEIPEYEEWNGKKVNNRIWIKVK
jgi:hypothetical protein